MKADEEKIAGLGRASTTALRVHVDMKRHPLISVPVAAKRLGLSNATVQSALGHLATLGTVREITGRQRGRLYSYAAYLALLEEGTGPLLR